MPPTLADRRRRGKHRQYGAGVTQPLVLELPTEHGPARAHVHRPSGDVTRGVVALGHGAGGGVAGPDLVAVTEVATGLGLVVVLVEQPYRVAGRRGSPRPPTLDTAWSQALTGLREGVTGVGADMGADVGLDAGPLVVGGRSAGARVACRTAVATGARGVLCLAFPLQPPGPAGRDRPSRLPELDAAGAPTLVVQGERDPYGLPPEGDGRTVVVVRGDHSLRSGLDGVRTAVASWLDALLVG
jgi:uncharacterized protein